MCIILQIRRQSIRICFRDGKEVAGGKKVQFANPLEKLKIENITRAKVTNTKRVEKNLLAGVKNSTF